MTAMDKQERQKYILAMQQDRMDKDMARTNPMLATYVAKTRAARLGREQWWLQRIGPRVDATLACALFVRQN